MNLQELKEKVAKQKGYNDWNDVESFGLRITVSIMETVAAKWALLNSKAFKIWCDNQVIAGRTTHKLFLDWQETLS